MTIGRARITITVELELDPENYVHVVDEDGNDLKLTPEQVEALTTQEMIEFEKRYLKHGDTTVEEYISDDFDAMEDMKWEVVE